VFDSAGSSNRWWMLMTGVVVRVSVLSEGLASSETSAIKHHTPGNNPKDYTQYVFYCYVYVFLLLCMYCFVYSVSLCCSVYCLCVNVYWTAVLCVLFVCKCVLYCCVVCTVCV
jgi:hypothetical protein